ncbi:MAG: tetratricopeptide repeat protein [Planctomycetes bacterium]|jgi:tetratricopeptide (TPR) repeat protein|nr:tetratricopeptide repeat protein [Planctomycetota bacterium]
MRDRILIPLLVLAAATPFARLLLAGDLSFVQDASRQVTEDPVAAANPSPGALLWNRSPTVSYSEAGAWRPLRAADLAADRALFGATPLSPGTVRWFHLRSVLWHAIAVLLLHALLRRWGLGRGDAFAGSLVFALHPVQVEAVASAAGRGDLLCVVFLLAGLLLHSRVRRCGMAGGLAATALALALLSKESAAVFLPLAALSDWFFRDGRRFRMTLRRWPAYLLYAALTAGWAVAWSGVPGAAGSVTRMIPGRWGETVVGAVLTLSKILAYYLRLVVLPVDMAFDFHLAEARRPDLFPVFLTVLFGVVLLWAARRAIRSGGPAAFAILWVGVALLPVSHLVLPLGIPTAERFLAVPLIGIALLAGVILGRAARAGRFGMLLAGTVIACLGAVSAERAGVWRSDDALWSSTMERVRSPRALTYEAARMRTLGELRAEESLRLLDANRTAEARAARDRSHAAAERALAFCDEALALWDKCPALGPGPGLSARAERSRALFGLRRHQEALEEADRVVRVRPGWHAGHHARALALLGLGRMREAAEEIETALLTLRTPEALLTAAAIHEKFAIEYEARGNRALAYRGLRRSWEIFHDPAANAGVRRALDAMQADRDGREKVLRERVRRDPSDGEAWLELASTYAQYGEYGAAEPIYLDLLRRAQGAARLDVMYHYALYFWQWRDTPEACRRAAALYEEILRSEPGLEEVRRQLEICREQTGDE